MDVLHNFDIEWQLLVAQIVNFLIIFYLLKRFLYKPIFTLLKKREDTIKDGLEKAEQSKKELVNAQEKEKKIIKEAQETARKIIQDAKDHSIEVGKEIEVKAKKQADQMIADAKGEIERQTIAAEKELNKHVSQIAVDVLKKSLDNVFSDKEQSEIVTKAVKDLQKTVN